MSEAPRKLDLILTCVGRTASGFYSKYLTSAGIPCGHEHIFNIYGYENAVKRLDKFPKLRADSSWQAAPHLDCDILKDAFVVHLIRHPKQNIESWMRQPTESVSVPYWEYAAKHCPKTDNLEYTIDRYAHRYTAWNRMIEEACANRPSVQFDIARDPIELLEILKEQGFLDEIPNVKLYNNREHNKHGRTPVRFHLDILHDKEVREELEQISSDYGYEWSQEPFRIVTPVVKAVITTLDNVDILKRQIDILRQEPLDEIIVVNNGSTDGTRVWLAGQDGLTIVHRENCGAGPGRNSGLDAAGKFDHVLMVDGGVLPGVNTVDKMLTYLEPRIGVGGIGVEVEDLRTDEDSAWLMWNEHISRTYQNRCLSHTAYGLFRWDMWDGFRFCTEGPFAEAGWGADDNEMMYQWLSAGKVLHVVTCGCRLPHFKGKCIGGSIHAYRKAGGSWARIKRETGLEPWGEGSVYEKRVLWLQHRWPEYDLGEQRDEPWMTIVIKAAQTIEETAAMIKEGHRLHLRKLGEPGNWKLPNPYSLLLWLKDAPDDVVTWAEQRHLRRFYGRTITVEGEVIHRTEENEPTWAGDFRLSYSDEWRSDLRPGAHYFGYCENTGEIDKMIKAYSAVHPHSRALKLKQRPSRMFTEIRTE